MLGVADAGDNYLSCEIIVIVNLGNLLDQVHASMLRRVRLSPEAAQQVFERVVANLEIFVDVGIVHADVSPDNILYWDGGIKIIDFPQAVDLYGNPNAPDLFARDVKNVCDFFSRCGVRCSAWDVLGQFKHLLPRTVIIP